MTDLEETFVDFLSDIEAAVARAKQQIGKRHGIGLKEDAFKTLIGWEKSEGKRIGEFEFTTRKANNSSDAFNHAYNILKANNATIKDHLSGESWTHYYWIWPEKPDTIYRKRRWGRPHNG